ncbi:MAG: cupin domain-containing protein [Candidatus Acidiferrales bacterium]
MATSRSETGNTTMNIVSESILRINPEGVDLQPDPIPSEWVLAGTPQARVTKLMTSRDWTSTVVVWECTPGSFKWHYSKDETIFFLSGEAFMTDENNEEHRFGAGNIAFIAAGTTCRWRVTEPIRKIAVVRETIWRPLGFVLKVSKKIFGGDHLELKTDDRPRRKLATD